MSFELFYISPELILAAGGLAALAFGISARKKVSGTSLFSSEVWCLLVLLAALVPTAVLIARGTNISQFFHIDDAGIGLWAVDGLALFFKVIAILSTGIVVLLGMDFFRGTFFHRGEFYALLIFAALAICCLAASNDLIMIYLSLEFLSLTSYVLTGYLKQDPKSNEASVKYFLFGAIASAVMLYGMSMLYGLAGTTNLVAIAEALWPIAQDTAAFHLIFMAAFFVLVGFGFKVAMVPFHQWSPDTYEGAPTPITAFLSVGSKAAGFAVLIRFFSTGISPEVLNWVPLIMILSGVTMTIGNLVAIPQLNIKRMLAYSSIAQAGYLLLGVAALPYSPLALPAVLMYLFVYVFMNLGAFGVVTVLSARLKSDDLRDYAGLIRRAPISATAMVIFLLSLAGILPTLGLVAKFYLFMAAIEAYGAYPPFLWLAVVAVVNVVISIYYYMNVARLMFFAKPRSVEPLKPSGPLNFAIGLTLAVIMLGLLYPKPFFSLAEASARMLSAL